MLFSPGYYSHVTGSWEIYSINSVDSPLLNIVNHKRALLSLRSCGDAAWPLWMTISSTSSCLMCWCRSWAGCLVKRLFSRLLDVTLIYYHFLPLSPCFSWIFTLQSATLSQSPQIHSSIWLRRCFWAKSSVSMSAFTSPSLSKLLVQELFSALCSSSF